MNINGIDVIKNYYITTDEPLMENLVRYSSDDWYVLFENQEFKIKDCTEIEENFQKTLLLSTIQDN